MAGGGWGKGTEGVNWRRLLCPSGRAAEDSTATTHTPDGPGSQVAELPSSKTDRASFTLHSRGTWCSGSDSGHRDLSLLAQLSQGRLRTQKNARCHQELLALKVMSR